jgi:hypothetical protein
MEVRGSVLVRIDFDPKTIKTSHQLFGLDKKRLAIPFEYGTVVMEDRLQPQRPLIQTFQGARVG